MAGRFYWKAKYQGLTNHWPMDSAVTDVVGGNDLTLQNEATWSTAASNPVGSGCLDLTDATGGSDYATMASSVEVTDGTNAGSFSMWIRSESSVGLGLLGSTANVSEWLQLNSSSRLRINRDGTTDHNLSTFTNSVWYHVVGNFIDDGSTVSEQMYKDGVAGSVGASKANAWDINTVGALYFGGNAWTGYIDDLRIYDRELEQHEIDFLYNYIGNA